MSWETLKEALMEIIFPPLCLNCSEYLPAGERTEFICAKCRSLIKLNSVLFCPECRARLAYNKKICHRDAPYLLAPAANYENPVIQNLIHYLKYKGFANIAPILGNLMLDYLKIVNLELVNYTLVPVPLHPKRERQRGFNQAGLIAQALSSRLDFPVSRSLKRIKNNKPQVGLRDYEERIKNVAGCFAIAEPESITGKNIILVDDVFTSGATMNEAARILKSAGAKKIIALTAAKA